MSGKPRVFNVRIFAPDSEIFTNRRFMVILDLTTDYGLRVAKEELNSMLRNLALQDRADAEISRYRLLVTDTEGESFDWTIY